MTEEHFRLTVGLLIVSATQGREPDEAIEILTDALVRLACATVPKPTVHELEAILESDD